MEDIILHARIPAIRTDPMCVWEKEPNEAECKAYEAEEEHIKDLWRKIINAEGFKGLLAKPDYSNYGRFITLTPSIRKENSLQLSFFDNKGAVRHETYIKNEEGMYDELYSLSSTGDIKVRFHVYS